jgi:hypothetical protein
MTKFLVVYVFLIVMFIVYFDYMFSIARLYLCSSSCSYSAHSLDLWVSGRHSISVELISCLSANGPYIQGHVVDHECDISVESSIVHSLNIRLARPLVAQCGYALILIRHCNLS